MAENTTSAENNFQSESNENHTGENGDTNILIAYFTAAENSGVDAVSSASYSMVNGEALGRLRAIANMIQTKTGGELFPVPHKTTAKIAKKSKKLFDIFIKIVYNKIFF